MSDNIKPISIGYNPGDFFYTLVGNHMPSDSSCNELLQIPDVSCHFIDPNSISNDDTLWRDNSFNCYKKELCINKQQSAKINEVENNHLGSQQNYKNSKKMYNNEILKTFNLSFGILIIFTTIYYIK